MYGESNMETYVTICKMLSPQYVLNKYSLLFLFSHLENQDKLWTWGLK